MRELIVTVLLIIGPALRPNPQVTPGLTRNLTVEQICTTKWGQDRRHVTTAMKEDVARAYGVDRADWSEYEFDHLVSRELGGADDTLNLWPQPLKGACTAHEKDVLENKLHRMVCAGSISLPTAQYELAHDWVAAYNQYIGKLVCP